MDVQQSSESDELEPEAIGVPNQFAVTDESSANWVCRKVTEARAYADRVKEWAERELRRAAQEEAWLTRRFGGELEQWVRGELASRGGKARSVRLPAAQVGFRTIPMSFGKIDTPALLPWCRRHLPEALRLRVDSKGHPASLLAALLDAHGLDVSTEHGVVVSEVQRHITDTGEIPPGTTVTRGSEKFFIR